MVRALRIGGVGRMFPEAVAQDIFPKNHDIAD
jgi:hypothetical protein